MIEGAWDIPENWVFTKVKELGKINTGNTPSKKDESNYGKYIPFVKPPELNDIVIDDANDRLSKKGAQKARILSSNSVLVSCIGNLGKTAMNKVPVAFNQQINAISFFDEIEPKYGFYFFQSPYAKTQLKALASATTIPIVNKSKFSSILFPLAPLSEQVCIVGRVEELLSRLTAGVRSLQTAQTRLEQYRQATLRQAYTGKLTQKWREKNPEIGSNLLNLDLIPQVKVRRDVPKIVDIPDDLFIYEDNLPSEWVFISIADLLNHNILLDLKDGNHGTNHPKKDEFRNEGLPFIVASDVYDFKIHYENAKKIQGEPLKRLNVGFSFPDDVILTHKGTVGRVAINNRNCVLSPQTTYYRVNQNYLDIRYIAYALLSPIFQYQLVKSKSQTTRDFVSISKQYRLFLPIPNITEQRIIVYELDRLYSIIDKIRMFINTINKRQQVLRQSILKVAFEGRLVPQNHEEEPARILLERIKVQKSRKLKQRRLS